MNISISADPAYSNNAPQCDCLKVCLGLSSWGIALKRESNVIVDGVEHLALCRVAQLYRIVMAPSRSLSMKEHYEAVVADYGRRPHSI